MEILDVIMKNIVPPLLVALFMYLIRLVAKMSAAVKANNRGTMILLRDAIIADHDRYIIKGEPMTSDAYENFVETFQAYQALDGNGLALKLFNEMQESHIGG